MELCLGTVQFGMQYGVASKGRPNVAQAVEMLERAADDGIRTIDTANAYGEAERIVGEFLTQSGREDINVITKIRPGLLFNIEPENYYGIIKQNLMDSLDTLKLKSIYGCLFHNAEYADNAAALRALAMLKEEGLVAKTGISVYLPREFRSAMESPYVDIIQAPYNILDRRMGGLIKKAKQEIHVRSVFLQGLLLMDAEDIPQKLIDAQPYIQKIDYFCERNGVTRMEVLLGFVKLLDKIDKIVFGVDNMEQLDNILEAFYSRVSEAELKDLADEISVIDERLVTPSLWHGEYK